MQFELEPVAQLVVNEGEAFGSCGRAFSSEKGQQFESTLVHIFYDKSSFYIIQHHNGYARRLMQSISYTKQYDLDTGEMSYREIRQRSVAQEDALLRLNLN